MAAGPMSPRRSAVPPAWLRQRHEIPRWSPDGRTIAYWTGPVSRPGGRHLVVGLHSAVERRHADAPDGRLRSGARCRCGRPTAGRCWSWRCGTAWRRPASDSIGGTCRSTAARLADREFSTGRDGADNLEQFDALVRGPWRESRFLLAIDGGIMVDSVDRTGNVARRARAPWCSEPAASQSRPRASTVTSCSRNRRSSG